MNQKQLDFENNVMAARMIARYLSDNNKLVWTVEEDVCVQGRTVANRYGVPADAFTRRYTIDHVEEGWTFTARAVWRNGKLMKPLAVHIVVESYNDANDVLGGTIGVRSAANAWLRSLPL